jgi:hypothetical protein
VKSDTHPVLTLEVSYLEVFIEYLLCEAAIGESGLLKKMSPKMAEKISGSQNQLPETDQAPKTKCKTVVQPTKMTLSQRIVEEPAPLCLDKKE